MFTKAINLIKNHTGIVVIILMIIIGFSIYANSLNGKFIWDDITLIKDNTYIKSWSNISKIFTEYIGAGANKEYYYYRPLQMLTHMTEYFFWGLGVKGYHIVNIAIHIVVALLIYWLVILLFGDKLLSLFTAILFIVHPIHVQTVAYISNRSQLLIALFILFCSIFYIKELKAPNRHYYIFAAISFVLAVLSKETALILPILLLLYHRTFSKKMNAKPPFLIISIALGYIIFRAAIISLPIPKISYVDAFQWLPGFFVAIINYIKLLFLPFNLYFDHGRPLFMFNNPASLGGMILVLLLLVYTWKIRNTRRLVFFSILWFFLTLLPVSNTIFPVAFYMTDHYLYLPSIGFFLIVAKGLCLLCRVRQFKIIALACMISLTGFNSYLTIKQNDYWRDPILFCERTLKYNPNSWRMNNSLCALYRDAKRYEEALSCCRKAINIRPNLACSYNNIGLIYLDLGKHNEALSFFRKVIEINPAFAGAYNNIGLIYFDLGKHNEALSFFRKAIEINPKSPRIYVNLGRVYYSLGEYRQAVSFFTKSIDGEPENIESYNALGVIYAMIGSYKKAIDLFDKAIAINPNHADVYSNSCHVYNNLGRYKEAIALGKKAIEIKPNHAIAYNNLAVAYYYNKQYRLAFKYCNKAIELGYKVNSEFLKTLRQVHNNGGDGL